MIYYLLLPQLHVPVPTCKMEFAVLSLDVEFHTESLSQESTRDIRQFVMCMTFEVMGKIRRR